MDEQIWRTIAPPYTPAPQDFELLRRSCPPSLLSEDAAPRILVLGMTPALVAAPWPERSEIHAVDFDQVMIDLHWSPAEGRHCHLARWQDLPFPDQHFDLIVGDGSFNSLPSLEGYDEVLREVARVRRPSAPLIARFFMQPEPRRALANLPREAPTEFAGWSSTAKRLAVVIAAARDDATVFFPDIPGLIAQEWGDIDEFLGTLGQTPAEIERAKSTYEMPQHVTHPTRAQIIERLAPFFSSVEFTFPDYDIGAQCPTVRCV
jgi:SAM-dependent methyltransferase